MHAVLAVTNDITTDQRVRRTAAALQKAGLEVTVIGRKLQPVHSGPDPFRTVRMVLWFRKGPMFYVEYNLRLLFHLLRIRYSLMVANDLDTLPAVFLASRLRRVSMLYDSHELFTGVPELVHRPVVRKIWEIIETLLLPRVSYSVTVSPLIAAYYNRKYGINMEVIRNLPVSSTAHAKSPSLRLGKEKIILYQGALNMGRGLESAIRAMQHTSGHRLVLIGTGDVEVSLKQLVHSLGLSEVVVFLGRISPDDLPGYTRQADLGISLEEDLGLNYRYAMPNKVFDYIMAGVPVLVSDLPMLRLLVEEFGIGKVAESCDPSTLAEIFLDMTESSDREVWKQNLSAAKAELCWEKEEPKFIALINKVLNS